MVKQGSHVALNVFVNISSFVVCGLAVSISLSQKRMICRLSATTITESITGKAKAIIVNLCPSPTIMLNATKTAVAAVKRTKIVFQSLPNKENRNNATPAAATGIIKRSSDLVLLSRVNFKNPSPAILAFSVNLFLEACSRISPTTFLRDSGFPAVSCFTIKVDSSPS